MRFNLKRLKRAAKANWVALLCGGLLLGFAPLGGKLAVLFVVGLWGWDVSREST